MHPQEILVIIGVLRHILVHSEACRGSLSSLLAELLELETISISWDIGLLSTVDLEIFVVKIFSWFA